MRCINQTSRSRRDGHVAVLIGFSMVAVIGMLAISLDGGMLLAERRHAQATADAAALAAAGELYTDYYNYSGYDTNGAGKAAALAAALQNRYSNDGTNTTVTVNIPPKSGNHVGKPGFAEVIVQSNEMRGFSSLFGSSRVPVIARAVAVGIPKELDVGILILDPTAKSAFTSSGNGKFVLEGAPITVDSSDQAGSIANGNGSFTAPQFDLVGNYSTSGGGTFNGPVSTSQPYVPDPLRYLPPPNPADLTQQGKKKTQFTSGVHALSPGVYKGGISASSTASLTLSPGIYYMDAGGFSFSGSGNLSAQGVLIYNAPGNGNADKISIDGQGAVTLSPMTSGIYQGMSLWQDRNSSVPAYVAGNGNANISGTFYFAGAQLTISGNGVMNNLGSQYISNQLKISGNGNMKVAWDSQKVARTRLISLVE